MKTAVITGGTRGLGFELAKCLRAKGLNVVVCGTSEAGVETAIRTLRAAGGAGGVAGTVCDVSVCGQVEALADFAERSFGAIDVWINNAGVNQSRACAWELVDDEIDFLLGVDLKGTINGSTVALRRMIRRGHGMICNVEGHGSNGAMIPGLTLYGTAKRAVTYFTDSLANEVKEKGLPVLVGKLSPGIMITDFLTSSKGKVGAFDLDEKTKKVYNILGDKPDVIATHLTEELLRAQRNGFRIEWLTKTKAAKRFMLSGFNKRDFFA